MKGKKNIIVDALTRLDLSPKQHDVIDDTETTTQLSYVNQKDMTKHQAKPFQFYQKQEENFSKRIKTDENREKCDDLMNKI